MHLILLTHLLAYYTVSSSAHDTRELLSVVLIQWTTLASAADLHVVKEGIAVTRFAGASHSLWVLVHTLVHGAMVVRCHEVSTVLPGPVVRAAEFGRDHDYSDSCGDVTQCTGKVPVLST